MQALDCITGGRVLYNLVFGELINFARRTEMSGANIIFLNEEMV